MKKQSYNFILFFVIGLTILQSCSKEYFDLNDNPNLVKVPSLGLLLTTSTHKTGINNYNVGSAISSYVQYTANPTASASSDTYQEVDLTGTWDALYLSMADITDLKTIAKDQGSSEYLGVSNVLLAYNLNLVADLWGNAPFSEAFTDENFTPKYDSQEDLYKTCMTLLDSAIAQLAITTSPVKLEAARDFIHGGSRPKWLQTAYALKARMLIKVSKTASYNPSAVLTALAGGYKSNADDAGMASFFTRNPWAQVAVNNIGLTLGGWLSEQLVDHLNGKTYGVFDPRIRKIASQTITGTYVGTVNGSGNRPPGNNTVRDESYIDSASPYSFTTGPLLLVTYAETKFIEAEAALASDPARAYAAYLAGINANMARLQVPDGPEKTAYLAAASVGAGSLTRALIFREKYVVTYLNPEAFNDARRFDFQYKDFTLPVGAVLPTFIRRVAYPVAERSKNGANVPTVTNLNERLWWDK